MCICTFIKTIIWPLGVSALDITGVPHGTDIWGPKKSSFKVYLILKE